MKMSKKNVTLTTGPFHVPRFNNTPDPNNRLIITFKNPTNTSLKASAEVSVCPNVPGDITLPFLFNTSEVLFANLPETTIPPMSCTRWELSIVNEVFKTLRVTTKGDYATDKNQPICGKLEISVTGGRGGETAGIPNAGLDSADPTLFFRYENFVLCGDKHHDTSDESSD